MPKPLKKRMITGVLLVAVGSSALAGCQTTGQNLARFNDVSDRCVAYRQPLIQTEQDLQAPIAGGAVVGAVVGGLLGGLATGKPAGAIAGALAGGLGGASLAYYDSRQKQARNQQELLAAIDGDARNDASRFTGLGSAITGLQGCRQQQIAELRQQVLAKQLTKDQAIAKRAQIQSSIRQDGDLVNAVFGHVDERVETYVNSRAKAMNTNDIQLALADGADSPVQARGNSGKSKKVQPAVQKNGTSEVFNAAKTAKASFSSGQAAQDSEMQNLDALLS